MNGMGFCIVSKNTSYEFAISKLDPGSYMSGSCAGAPVKLIASSLCHPIRKQKKLELICENKRGRKII